MSRSYFVSDSSFISWNKLVTENHIHRQSGATGKVGDTLKCVCCSVSEQAGQWLWMLKTRKMWLSLRVTTQSCRLAGSRGTDVRRGSEAWVPLTTLPWTSCATQAVQATSVGIPTLAGIWGPFPLLGLCFPQLEGVALLGKVQNGRLHPGPRRPRPPSNCHLGSLCAPGCHIPGFQVSSLRKMLQGLTNVYVSQ